MKRFYTKLVVFSIVILIAFIVISTKDPFRSVVADLTLSDELLTINNGPEEIGPYIDKAREQNDYTKLIIGDSVCHQMFTDLQEYNDDICIIGSNAAITMAGQYVLLHEFLDNHSNVTDVWLIIIPGSMTSFFDQYYGYEYVVMPNVEKNTMSLFDANTVEQLEYSYGKVFLNPYVVWLLDRSAPLRKIYLNMLLKYGGGYGYAPMSPISIQYISKMEMLCKNRNITFHLIPGPISSDRKEINQEVLKEFDDNDFDKRFPNYEASIKYYPDDQFIDSIHFGGEYANQASYNEKIKQLGDESLLKYLRFE